MSERPYGQNPVSKLEPLDFRLLNDDGKAAVYQAMTVDYEHPRVPVYTVTVTIASAVRREAGEQLQAFLGEMKAAFSLLPEPPPDDDPPDDEDEFDIETQMRIDLNLISIRGLKDDELVGVFAIVETTIGPEGDTSGSNVAEDAVAEEAVVRAAAPNYALGGIAQYWWAFCNRQLDGTVTPSGGTGTMRQWRVDPGTPVSMGHPGTLKKVRQIIVRSAHGMGYAFGGTFKGPHSGPRPGKPC
jgi:hypothetical protein